MGKKLIGVILIACLLFLCIYVPNTNRRVPVTYTDEVSEEQNAEPMVLSLTETETRLLAQFIKNEAPNEELKAKLVVGLVVLNRTSSPDFPNSITEVITAPGYFQLPETGLDNIAITDADIQMVNKIVDIYNNKTPVEDENGNNLTRSFFWYNPNYTDAETAKTLEKTYKPLGQIGERKFLAGTASGE